MISIFHTIYACYTPLSSDSRKSRDTAKTPDKNLQSPALILYCVVKCSYTFYIE